jgi:DNA-binding IclR family transcriptional regulator
VCCGVPIVSPFGKVEASISLSIPLIRFEEKRERAIISALLQASRGIADS